MAVLQQTVPDCTRACDLVRHGRLLTEMAALRLGSSVVVLGKDCLWVGRTLRVVVWARELLVGRSYTEGKTGRATIEGSQSNLRCAARERFGSTAVSSTLK
jgi:hypothetical protein